MIFSLTTLSLYRLSILWYPQATSRVAALLFAFHPIHVEAVASLVGRADSLCGLLFIAAMHWYSLAIQVNKQSHLYIYIQDSKSDNNIKRRDTLLLLYHR